MFIIKLLIKDRDGNDVFYTQDESCVPVDKLESMRSAGFYFYFDGVRISLMHLMEKFKSSDTTASHHDEPDTKVEPEAKIESDAHEESVGTKTPFTEINITDVDFPVTSRTILCKTTGKIYRTQKDAGEDLGIDPSWISYCITQNKEYKGYEFAKVIDLQ